MDSILKSIIEETQTKVRNEECEIVGIRPAEEIFNMIEVLSTLNKKPFTDFFTNKISERLISIYSQLMKTQEGVDLYCELVKKIEDPDINTAFDAITFNSYKEDIKEIPSNKLAVIFEDTLGDYDFSFDTLEPEE